MHEYDEAVLRCFLENQGQLFPEDVAENMEEAEAFLEDCMAVVVDGPDEVEEYFEESGRLIIEIGMCPVKPAEFVIFRISQWAGPNAE